MKVVIAAVPYSDNLGDGVIAENIKHCCPKNWDVECCDISYRTEVSDFSGKDKSIDFFMKLPLPLRQLIVFIFFFLKFTLKGKGYLSQKIQGADLLLIGGGQILSDVDLNFPVKLYFLVKLAEKYNVPIKVISVGVSSKWSGIGKYLVNRVLTSKNVVDISVRDKLSKENISKFNVDFSGVKLLPDPALLSVNTFNFDVDKNQGNKFGLGVANIDALEYSSDLKCKRSENTLEDYLKIVSYANSIGYQVFLFTNGAQEDELFLRGELIPFLNSKSQDFFVLDRFRSPSELVRFISSLDILIAYRLHANIIAASFSIPHYSVSWDSKVSSFFELQRRQKSIYSSLNYLANDLPDIFDIKSNTMCSAICIDKLNQDYNEFLRL